MKHADSQTLEQIAVLLNDIRQRVPPLKEKQPGIFYLKSTAFLHFHHDPIGIFADLKVNGNWVRYPVNENKERAALLSALDEELQTR
jgi:hypothetical protein